MKKLFISLICVITPLGFYAPFAEAAKSPSFKCIEPNCGAWHEGMPQHGGLCPNCYNKLMQRWEMLNELGFGCDDSDGFSGKKIGSNNGIC